LKNNRSIKGNQTLTVTALKAASTFYGKEMNTLKKRELTLKNNLNKLKTEKKKFQIN